MLAELGHCESAVVTDRETISIIFRFRCEVWEATGCLAQTAFPKGTWRDPHDEVATHWAIRDDAGRVVATARQTIHSRLDDCPDSEHFSDYLTELAGPIAAPAREVVCPAVQGRGLGAELLDLQDAAAKRASCRHALRLASPALVPLLERRGWQILGPARIDPRFPNVEFQVALLAYEASERD